MSCFHQLVSRPALADSGKPYRYLCLKCGEPFKILTGRLMTYSEERLRTSRFPQPSPPARLHQDVSTTPPSV